MTERGPIEVGRRLPEALARDLAHAGFFRFFLPAVYGGLDLGPVEAMEVYEELARADASVAWCVWNCNINWTTARLAQEAAQEVYADPNMILANSTRPMGRVEVVEGGYRVSGRGEWLPDQHLAYPDVHRLPKRPATTHVVGNV